MMRFTLPDHMTMNHVLMDLRTNGSLSLRMLNMISRLSIDCNLTLSNYGGYNVKFSDATEARTDIIEYKGGMEFTFSPDDDQVSRLSSNHSIPYTTLCTQRIVSHSNRRRHVRIPSQHVITRNLISYEII